MLKKDSKSRIIMAPKKVGMETVALCAAGKGRTRARGRRKQTLEKPIILKEKGGLTEKGLLPREGRQQGKAVPVPPRRARGGEGWGKRPFGRGGEDGRRATPKGKRVRGGGKNSLP